MSRLAWSAVVVNYNAGSFLANCVRSILDDDSAPVEQVVVVDNASSDQSLAGLPADARVSVVHAGANLGYAAAANLGVLATRTPLVAVLNPDIVFEHGTAVAMCAPFEANPILGAAGPRIRDARGADYPSARSIPSFGNAVGHFALGWIAPQNRWSRAYKQVDIDPALAREAGWVSGAAIWFARGALDAIGGWDERYFMFLEDVDVCTRLRENGWQVRYEPAATIVHVEGVSRAHHPYRTLADHHRAAWRFADAHWRGARRLLLWPAAGLLALRAALLVAVAVVKQRRS